MSLSAAISDFKAEHGPEWSQEMRNKADAYLALLVEYFGPDKAMDQITRQDAAEMKQVVLSMPVNRKTKPETRDLTLQEAIAVPGLPTLSTKTANSYLDMFRRFWDWAEKHGRAPEKLFFDMKVKARKKADNGRKMFTPAQTKRLLQELTENTSGLVKSDEYKWATLLALYTGARRREIAQLFLTDIRQEGDIWFIDINEEGERK